MHINFIPILVVPAVPFEGGIRFLHRKNQIDINPNMAEVVWKILSFCNGYNEISFIVKSTGFPEDEVLEILSELEEMELVVDSRHQFMHFHRISNYPTTINSGLTQKEIENYTKSDRSPVKTGKMITLKCNHNSALHPIREKRRSCRNFSDRKLTLDQIGNICHYAYSIPDHSVPSGGALYPLRIYVLIEIGHVAENISLYCAEQGLGACEMGGVQDEPLKQELELDGNIWPILAIPIGYSASSKTGQLNKIAFIEEHVGESCPVKNIWTHVFDDDGSFFGATTTYLNENGNIQYAGATSSSYADAAFKATIEGYERFYSSQVRIDFRGSANEIRGKKWLDPKLYFPLTEEQAEKCGVKPFTEDLIINWTLGVDYDSAEQLRWLYEDGCHKGYIEPIMKLNDFDWFCSEHLKLVTVDLSSPKSNLKIVRAFSPYLVPINFGFNTAHYTHPIVKHSVVINPRSLDMPHYFA